MYETINPVSELPPKTKAIVEVYGLSLLCFSEKNKRAEVGFLNVAGHPLIIEIYEYERGNANLIYGRNLSPGTVVSINQNTPGMGKTYCPADQNSKDFRKMIDLHREYDNLPKVRENSEFFAKAYIHNAVFYTADRCNYDARFEWMVKGEVKTKDLGRCGKVTGAVMTDENFTVNVSNGKQPEINSDKTYKIVLRYRCTQPEENDFEYVYDVLEEFGDYPRYKLVHSPFESAWLSDEEFERFKSLGERINAMFTEKNKKSLNRGDKESLAEELENITPYLRDTKACENIVLAGQPREL